jgi:hypothetical protein
MACVSNLLNRYLGVQKVVVLVVLPLFVASLHSQAPTPNPAAISTPPTADAVSTGSNSVATSEPVPSSTAPALPPPPPPPGDQSIEPSENPDEQVKFRFTFEGDNSPPSIGSQPDLPPPPPPPQPEVDPSEYLGHDPNEPVTYSLDDEEEIEKTKKKKSKAGMQWDQLMVEFGKFGNWYLANVIWTGPTSGVLLIGVATLFVMGRIKRKKQLQAIQDKFAQRSQNRPKKFAGAVKSKNSPKAPKAKAPSGPSKPPPVAFENSVGEHLFLCFTGYDEEAAKLFQKRLKKEGYLIEVRDLASGANKIFDLDTVDKISSSRAVLLLASSSAYNSERVQQETEHARDEEKLIVPIYLDDEELPKHFSYLGEDPEFVYFNPDDAKNSIQDVVNFLQSKDLLPS